MPKQPVALDFSQGVNTKSDPWHIPIGQFQSLKNTILTKQGLMQKRNGYGQISQLPTGNYNYLTTLNDNLTAIGQNVAAYNEGPATWVTKGSIQPCSLKVLPLVRNSLNQVQCDSVVASNDTVCTVYTETTGSVTSYKYVIANSVTGQNIIAPTLIPVTSGAVAGSPRVFLLGGYFVIVFTNLISSTNHIQYIAISVSNPGIVTTAQDIASAYTPASTVSWDGLVFSENLYVAYNTTSGGQSVKVTFLSVPVAAVGGTPAPPVTFTSRIATMMSLAVDSTVTNPYIYVAFYDSASSTGYAAAIDVGLNVLQTPVEIIASGTVLNITCAAQNGVCSIYYEVSNAYGYDSTIKTNFINLVALTGATASSAITVIRGLGLASKAFIIDGIIYFLSASSSQFQSTYFVINGNSTQGSPLITAKLAYENGGGYLPLGLPGVTVNGFVIQTSYLYKDLIEPINTLNNTQQTTSGGVYAQTGINLVTFDFALENITSVEIANGLQIGGGFGWLYDGYLPVEQNFFLWPENIEVSTSTSAVTPTGTVTTGSNVITAVSSMVGVGLGASVSGTGIPAAQFVTGITSNTITFGPSVSSGSHTAETITVTGNITAQSPYFYQAVYRWVDNSGNIYFSAGSIPVSQVTTTANSTNTINIPTLRQTYKIANPPTIDLFRWSPLQEEYFQVTSVTAPVVNSTTIDSVIIYDSQSDAQISGNSLIYLTGGVVEDINPPASNVLTLFDTRVWAVNAEDPNQEYFTKQVIEATPAEWSDLLTEYIAPNAGTVSSTGPITAHAPMDDKLIIFKQNSMYYINGQGPDNTGANNAYNGPIFITSTVGCTNQASIVLIDTGLMFQSNKGIWLLPRGISAPVYIGAPVEAFNSSLVQSAVSVPTTNQVRFTLNTGETLMYDYFYNQWGTFAGVPAVSSCIYQNLHSFVNEFGQVYQETENKYLDGSNPVLMSFKTGWINLAALSGFERLYYFYLLGRFLSPCKIQVQIAYDYNETPSQSSIILPTNFSSSVASPFGDQPSPFGSPIDVLQWEIHAKRQKCQAFQITLNEIYDPSYGVVAGAGFTLSGITMYTMVKSSKRPLRAANTVG